MEFHAAGVVIGPFPESDSAEAEMSVLYLNPFTASVERRARTMGTVILYEFPPDDGVYWRLWEQTRSKLESLRSDP